MKRAIWKAAPWLLLSVVILMLGIILDVKSHHEKERYFLLPYIIETCKILGGTGIALSLVNIVLETNDWREYFEKRLQNIIVKQDYINELDSDALKRLNLNILRTQFKDVALENESGFLKYFNDNIHSYIGAPYRERAKASVRYEDESDETWIVNDTFSYVCRKNGKNIQPNVTWYYETPEDVISIEITLYPPIGSTAKEVILFSFPSNETKLDILQTGISLNQYKDHDGSVIKIVAKYKLKKSEFSSWQMTNVTKGIDLELQFPSDWRCTHYTFLTESQRLMIDESAGRFACSCEGWLMPENGFVWQLINNKIDQRQAPKKPTPPDTRIGSDD